MRKQKEKLMFGILFFILALFSNPILGLAEEIDDRSLYQQASEEANQQRYPEAVLLLQEIIDEDYADLEAHMALIDVKVQQGQKLDEMSQGYAQRLYQNPKDFVALHNLGFIGILKKDLEQAEDYYLRALELAPEKAELYESLAYIALRGKQDFAKTKEYLDASAAINPDSYRLHITLAGFYLGKMSREEDYTVFAEYALLARREAEKALAMRPYVATPYTFLGYTYFAEFDYEKAVEIFHEALDIDRQDHMTNLALAELLISEGRYEEAKPHLIAIRNSLTEIDQAWDVEQPVNEYLQIFAIQDKVQPVLISVVGFMILFFSIMLHEYMHGWMADKCGDPTAKNAGRLSFNPLVHIDLFGSVILPIVLLASHSSFLIGWAKPVPVNPYNFRNRRKGDILVSLAGPLSNIFLGIILIILLMACGYYFNLKGFETLGFHLLSNKMIVSAGSESVLWTYVVSIIKNGIIINFILAGLNLLPIPPLDGSHILMALLPLKWMEKVYGAVAAFGMIIIAFLAFSGFLDVLLYPSFLVLVLVFSLIGRFFGLR